MACRRCREDPQPPEFGDPRKCAFSDDGGEFVSENWNCATLNALMSDTRLPLTEIDGCDESVQVIIGRDYGGFIALTRYKHRGRTTSAVLVGDFWPPRPLTLAMAEAWLDGSFWNEQEGERG